jgi:quinol monooxygenase YgiN
MPTLPWISVRPADAPAVVMASRFELRRLRDVPRFFLDAMRIHRQVRAADGVLGVSLVAHPLRREFYTLSAWRDRAAVDALVRAEPHRSTMGRYHAVMADAAFRFWEVPPEELPPSWDDAQRRLAPSPPEGER